MAWVYKGWRGLWSFVQEGVRGWLGFIRDGWWLNGGLWSFVQGSVRGSRSDLDGIDRGLKGGCGPFSRGELLGVSE